MTASRHPRVPVDRARTVTIRAAQALVVLLTMVLGVFAPVQAAAPPAGLAARDWQAIEAQLPAAPQSWPAAGGAIEQDKLVASDAQASDYFGYSVAVSGDTVVVGTPFEDSAGSSAGTAYVFVRNGTSWVQQDKLMANDAEMLDQFGLSVAVSGDTVVVGANGEDSEGNAAGAAYVFVRNGTSWNEQDKLTASDAQADDRFGHSVAVAGDTVVVGAFLEDEGGSDAGAAYVFVRNGTTWNEQDKLVASDAETGDWFGRSVAVSGDIVAVGALGEAEGGTDAGAAYVFVRNGTSWDEQDKLVASDAQAYDFFGTSVAVSGDTVVVGAYGEDDGGTDAGAAYVFKRNGTSWSQQDKLMAGDAQAGDRFGYSVAVSGDTVVVGAYREDSGGTNAGAAYVFVYDGTTWDEQQKLMASDAAASDNFGHSVAVSGDTVVVGTPFEDSAGSDVGAAYVYVPGYAVEVDVGGLSGTGLVLQNNGGDDLAIAADGLHAFSTLLADGSAYDVTVATQPTNPPQTCTVSGGDNDDGSGTMAGAPVTVSVTCATVSYTVTATASGNGTVTPASQSVDHGDTATITVTPAMGHHVVSVTGDTCTPADNGDGTWTAPNITADCAITATFAINAYTVTATASGNGTATPASQSVDHGDTATITVTPAMGHHVVSVTGDTCTPADNGDGTWTAPNITADCAITATFAINAYTVTATAIGNGTVTPASQSVDHGDTATITVTPAMGHHVVSVTGDTCTPADNGDGTWTAPNITADCAITATFAINAYTVTATASGNGTVTPASQSVDHGDTATITVTPAMGHHVVSVTGDTCTPADNGDGTWTAPNITADCAITATFAINAYTVTATASGNGTATPASQSVDHGDTATITVTPAMGHHVVSVTGDTCTPADNGDGTWTAPNITADCAITATFAINAYTVTATASGNGTVTPASQNVDHGDTATFTVTPDAGHHVDTIGGTCPAGTLTGSSYQTGAITGDCSVTVAFAPDAPAVYVVTASASGNGTVTPASQSVDHGDTATFTVTPDAGHHVDTIGGTCPAGTLTGSSYQTGAITGDCSVTVAFAPDAPAVYVVTASASGNGTVTPASQSVDHGDTATITVTPAMGHHVVSVTGDTCTPADNGDGTWTAPNITADCAITATFAINAYTVTATASGNGTVTPASQSVDHGDAATFTVTPDAGHHVDTIGGTCPAGTLTGSSYQTGAITGDCSVTVAFAPDAPAVYVVTANATGNGTIAPASQSVTHGSAATFTVTPDAGHHVDTIGGTCPAGTLTGTSYQTGPITGDCSVEVAFAVTVAATATPVPVDARWALLLLAALLAAAGLWTGRREMQA